MLSFRFKFNEIYNFLFRKQLVSNNTISRYHSPFGNLGSTLSTITTSHLKLTICHLGKTFLSKLVLGKREQCFCEASYFDRINMTKNWLA